MTATAPTQGGLTATCQSDTFTTTALVAALEAAWTAIRVLHPEVPPVVLIVGSGSPTKATDSVTWGHFATSTWQHGDTRLPEVMVSGEGLSRTPSQVLSTLLHEAAHGLASTRQIKDTSRQGRWHNKKFAGLAEELGLTVTQDPKLGWSPSTLADGTAGRYPAVIGDLGAAMRAHRRLDLLESTERRKNNNGVSAQCACPRKVRVSVKVLAAGPIWCGVCDAEFTAPDDEDGEPA